MILESFDGSSIENPSEKDIEMLIARLSHTGAYACLTLTPDGATYVQAANSGPTGFTVERQEGDVDQHFRSQRRVTMQEVLRIFRLAASGTDSWKDLLDWAAFDFAAEGSQEYPKPDRSQHPPNFTKSADNEQVDIGWAEGYLDDGRVIRAECWAQDQVTCITFFLSTISLEELDPDSVVALLEAEGLFRFAGSDRYASATKIFDDSGNEMWSVNLVVGDEERTFVDDSLVLTPYSN